MPRQRSRWIQIQPNIETDDGITPLVSAVAAGSVQCLELLIQSGAKVNIITGGATPLHIAGDIGNSELITCLLKAGADPNMTDEDGLKPVQVAAGRGNRGAVEMLLPLSSQVETVKDWTVDGIINHMQAEGAKEQKETQQILQLTRQATLQFQPKKYRRKVNCFKAGIQIASQKCLEDKM